MNTYIELEAIGCNPEVYEIKGYRKKTFIKTLVFGKNDYSRANSAGSRGIYIEYILEGGKIYEIHERISWKKTNIYFLSIDSETAEKTVLEEEEVFEQTKEYCTLEFPHVSDAQLNFALDLHYNSSIREKFLKVYKIHRYLAIYYRAKNIEIELDKNAVELASTFEHDGSDGSTLSAHDVIELLKNVESTSLVKKMSGVKELLIKDGKSADKNSVKKEEYSIQKFMEKIITEYINNTPQKEVEIIDTLFMAEVEDIPPLISCFDYKSPMAEFLKDFLAMKIVGRV